MMIRLARFNFNLLLAGLVFLLAGCQTPEEEKVQATVRVHLEANPDGTTMTSVAPIYRASPIPVNIRSSAIVTEADLEKADLLEASDGFALRIRFDRMGGRLLEQYSAMNPGKRFAIFCQFGKKLETARWLAAPQSKRRITDGTIVFTPDCTREEAEQIVLGLNNVVAERKKADLVK